tara:strand:- start:17431 stop:20355 length:2925 start_codon:yes stop_codon:yes gene_type:complete
MSKEITSLVLNVKSDTVEKASDRLNELTKATKGAETGASKLTKTEGKRAGATKKTAVETSKASTQVSKYNKETRSLRSTKDRFTSSETRATRATRENARATRENTAAKSRNNAASRKSGGSMAALAVRVGGLSAAFLALKGSISAAADLETLETSLVSITGSAAAAKTTLKDLTDFTAKTPFQIEGVAGAAKQLITAKGSTQGLKQELKMLGDLAATVGVPINDLASIYVKAFNKGKVQAEELNQISERGIPIIRLLAEEYNVTAAEVFQMGTDGQIAFEDLRRVLQKTGEEGGLAFNAMQRQSETFNGSMSTLKDNIKLTAGEIGGLVIEMLKLKQFINLNSEWLAAFRIGLQNINDPNKEFRELSEEGADALKKYEESTKSVASLLAEEAQNQKSINELSSQRNVLYLEQQALLKENDKWNYDKPIAGLKEQIDKIRVKEREERKAGIEIRKQIRAHDENNVAIERAKFNLTQNKIEIDEITLKYKLGASASSTVTEKDEERLKSLHNQNTSLAEQIAKYNEVTAAATQAATAASIAASATGKAFAAIESGLMTPTERINDNYKKQIEGIDAYSKALKEANISEEEQTKRIAAARERAATARDVALEGLKPKEATPKTPRAKRGRSPRATSVASGPSEFEILQSELQQSEDAIESSYLKRLELVRNNTEAGSALRAELSQKLAEQRQQESDEFAEKTLREYDIVKSGFSLQLDELNAFYQRRKEIILENETLTEEEKTALVEKTTQERNELTKNLEGARFKQGLEMADNFFGNFSQLAKSGNKKLAKVGEAALKAQKAISIAQATVKTYESATSAYASMAGIPVVGPALGVAAAAGAIAAGLANVAAIATSPTSVGSYATGGIVPGSSYSGDSLTANVNSAEMILNRQQQSQLFNMANGGGSQNGGGNVVIINQTTTPVEAETRVNAKGEREITIREAVNRTKAELTNEADTGGGTVVPALQRNFELRRRGA